MVLSTKTPNNCIKVDDEIGRIQEIFKKENGEIILKMKMIDNLSDTFVCPIASSDVNMYECVKEKFSDNVFKNILNNVVKVAGIELRNKTHHSALLH